MALPRIRWSNTGAELIRTQARDGAMVRSVRSIDEPQGSRDETHVHVWLDGLAAPRPSARRTHDAAPVRAPVDQPRRAGRRIDLAGRDAEGQNWSAMIYGPSTESYEGDPTPDEIIAAAPTATGVASINSPDEGDSIRAYERHLAASNVGKGA